MADVSTAQRLAAVRDQLEPLAASIDVETLERRVRELEEEMGAPGFWDDQERAAKVSAEHARLTRRIEEFSSLQGDVDDLGGLVDLAAEDESIAGELDTHFASVEDRLATLELERLFSGSYDAGDALV